MTRDEKLGLGALGLALAWSWFARTPRTSATTTTPPSTLGAWPIVPAVNTGRTLDRNTFDRQHYDALQTALAAHNAPVAIRPKLARAMLAHMISETGRTAEWNYNVANSVPNANWHGNVFQLPSTTGHERAYPTLQAGVDDYVTSITGGTYGALVGDLAAGSLDEVQWYQATREAGWSDARPSLADLALYNNIMARLRAEFPG